MPGQGRGSADGAGAVPWNGKMSVLRRRSTCTCTLVVHLRTEQGTALAETLASVSWSEILHFSSRLVQLANVGERWRGCGKMRKVWVGENGEFV